MPLGSVRPVEKAIRDLEAEDVLWATALSRLLRAGALALRGDAAGAERALRDAIRDLSAASMALHAEVARARLAELLGDIEGIEKAHADIATRGIQNPARVVDCLAPGAFRPKAS